MTFKAEIRNESANPLYLIFRYVNGYFVEISGTKYLTPVTTNENKQTNKQTNKQKTMWIAVEYNQQSS